MASILVTQGELKQTLGVVRELGKMGHQVDVMSMGKYSIHGFSVASFSKYCHRSHKVSNYKDENSIRQELLSIICKRKYDFVLPIGAPFVHWLTKNRVEIEKYAKIPFPDADIIELYENKEYTWKIAKGLGIPTPVTIFPNFIDEVDQLSLNLQYPVVIKAKKESGGNIVDYAYNKKDLKDKYQILVKKNGLFNDLPLIQEYLTGVGAGYFGLFKEGICFQSFQHRRVREYPISGGASCCAVSIYDEKIAEYGHKILQNAKWDGIAMVEFKYNSKGEPCFLEVNPKFWGSYDLSVACKINFAHKLICLQSGLPFQEQENYKEGVIFSWPYNGDLLHCTKKHIVLKLCRDILLRRVNTNITWKDWKASMAIRANWVVERFYAFYAGTKKLFK